MPGSETRAAVGSSSLMVLSSVMFAGSYISDHGARHTSEANARRAGTLGLVHCRVAQSGSDPGLAAAHVAGGEHVGARDLLIDLPGADVAGLVEIDAEHLLHRV